MGFLHNSPQDRIVIFSVRTFAASIDFDIYQFGYSDNGDSGIQNNAKIENHYAAIWKKQIICKNRSTEVTETDNTKTDTIS